MDVEMNRWWRALAAAAKKDRRAMKEAEGRKRKWGRRRH